MAQINTKISSLCLQCFDTLSSLIQSNSRPLSTSLKSIRYQVCPPKKNAYQVISKITPQLLEQIQKKSLGAGLLQPGRLPHIFNTHPLSLPLVSPGVQSESFLKPEKSKSLGTESKCFLCTSSIRYKSKKGKGKKSKGKKGDKCKGDKKKGKGKKKDKKKKCKLHTSSDSGCPNIKLPNCTPTTSKLCTRDSQWPECNKKCAPYPAYSESCHEDVPLPPSECRICPWTKDNHPTFKEKPRKYHTGPTTDGRVRCPGADVLGSLLEEPAMESPAPMLCNKCGKDGGDDGCGTKVKKCKKDKKKKKQQKKKDKCKKKPKKCDKKKPKKRNCNPKWRHPPCEKPKGESKICPTDLIKKPKCP